MSEAQRGRQWGLEIVRQLGGRTGTALVEAVLSPEVRRMALRARRSPGRPVVDVGPGRTGPRPAPAVAGEELRRG